MRVVFSIIHNGLHHVFHNNQYQRILKSCDFWIVVEGASLPQGSTSWCNEFPPEFHNDGSSIDGTKEFFTLLSRQFDNVKFVPSSGFWQSKDHQVNRAIDEVKKLTNSCWLWEIDIDEQWSSEQMDQAESELASCGAKSGCFRAKCFIGKNLRAIGDWGEARHSGYTRLWKWEGEYFLCHEPPVLQGMMGVEPKMLTPVFKHYNYYFDKDVLFKDRWYGGHENIFDRWQFLNSLDKRFFPMHISNLIVGPWGRSNSAIIFDDTDSIGKIVQIGANIGHDHVFEIAKSNQYECLLVEPNVHSVEHLKNCYTEVRSCIFENCAITNYDGFLEIHFNDMSSGDSSHSSISRQHVLDHGNAIERITTQSVPCMRLETLLKKHGWIHQHIDWLFIDTEGHDCDIILDMDLDKINVKNIYFEYVHSDGVFKTGEKLSKTISFLESNGYLRNIRYGDEHNMVFSRI